jgi:hypothetical protein
MRVALLLLLCSVYAGALAGLSVGKPYFLADVVTRLYMDLAVNTLEPVAIAWHGALREIWLDEEMSDKGEDKFIRHLPNGCTEVPMTFPHVGRALGEALWMADERGTEKYHLTCHEWNLSDEQYRDVLFYLIKSRLENGPDVEGRPSCYVIFKVKE